MIKADELFGAGVVFPTITRLHSYARELEQSVLDAQADTAAIEQDNANLRIQLDEARTLAENCNETSGGLRNMMIDHQREHDFEDIRDSARERSRSRIPKLAAERTWPRHAERSDLGLGGCPMTALGWLRVIRTAWVLGGYYWVEGEGWMRWRSESPRWRVD